MLLELNQVCKRFGAVVVADKINLSVNEGEALGVIGANGAGKSSLFNLITGVIPADSGSIRLAGEDVTRRSVKDRCLAGIGRSFQIPQPFETLTVFENLYTAAMFGTRDVQDRVNFCADILRRTGLLDKANTVAGSLTLLNRKRLELARALATRPRLLLLDEIAGGLTEAECHELVTLIKSLHAGGITIVWIEHVVHALLSVATRLIVLESGRMIAEGDPREVMASPEVKRSYLGVDEVA